MSNLKITKNSTLISAIEFIIGLILLFRPEGFTSVIIVCLGIVLILLGASSTVNYFRTEKSEAMKTNLLSKGLLCLIGGMFFAFNSKWFIKTFPISTVLYGVFMLLLGVVKFQSSADAFRFKMKYWYINLIGAVLTLFSSVTIITNPFTSTEFVWKYIAIALLVEAVLDILSYLLSNKETDTPVNADTVITTE
ncbi:MAG: DUF308 domain-containing protein [Clostridia bacterium]|nr:DUF308 domain-containing protein [Clostridia bacterium]